MLDPKYCSYYFPNIKHISSQIKVIDGDTIILDKTKIRLIGIDAPELKQHCGKIKCGEKAKEFLVRLTQNKTVKCSDEGLDKYERTLSYCFIGNTSINSLMIKSGNAVAYGANSFIFYPAELKAKYHQKGIWKTGFVAPFEWRKKHKQKH